MTDISQLLESLSDEDRKAFEEKLQKEIWLKQFLTKKKELEAESKRAEKNLVNHLSTCTHPNLIYQNQGSDGGWDYDPSYWTVWKCDVCGRRWTTEHDYHKVLLPMLKKYPWAKEYDYWHNGMKKI